MLVAQSYQTLCNPMVCSLPGSFVHGILQARVLEKVAIPFRIHRKKLNFMLTECVGFKFCV